ncbi:hypothetical protein RclHR1_13770001 [Rhizophagus clarus]|uniref:Uncharacterized protein n=1 Tax=Rhizophagus clarus TaxID=94130 RepID=A0A2Z6QAY8_9GLOM|nr:hypothetical protein RclHR1_13770001 [Rhizophagus clarus]
MNCIFEVESYLIQICFYIIIIIYKTCQNRLSDNDIFDFIGGKNSPRKFSAPVVPPKVNSFDIFKNACSSSLSKDLSLLSSILSFSKSSI